MKTIAFGPERDVPSWGWVGFDTARELSKYFKVLFFKSFDEIPFADVVMIIKQNCPYGKIVKLKERNPKVKIIYCPIDFYQETRFIRSDASFLKACNMILSHSERLMPIFRSHNNNVHFVEHNNKYALPSMADYKEEGFILWIGGCQYIPYLLDWIKRFPIKNEIKILSDVDNDRARKTAQVYAANIGMDFTIAPEAKSVAGIETYVWSERLQHEMMNEAKAAIDIKMTDQLNQNYKPPTKAQKYIASGIPFAANSESYSYEYFKQRGFNIVTPNNTKRWFSIEYWQETRVFGEKLRIYTSLENVGLRYKELIERLYGRENKQR